LQNFEHIYAMALAHKGPTLEESLPHPQPAEALLAISDDRYLASMTRSVFQSGFVWRVVEHKWPGFETVFQHFNPELLSILPEDVYGQMATDQRIIRNGQKVQTVRKNAQMIVDITAEHGSFGRFLAQWPADNIVGLWEVLVKRGARLGGNTGPFFLRRQGKDTFLFTRDVTVALQRMDIIGKNPHTKGSGKAAQLAFNTWCQQSGRSLSEISRILSYTVVS